MLNGLYVITDNILTPNETILFQVEEALKSGAKIVQLRDKKNPLNIVEEIREKFSGIIGVSCYGNLSLAKEFEKKGADYVAFGSFFSSPTKPNSNIVELEILLEAKKSLNIPICAIGGINSKNVDKVLKYKPDIIALISDIWKSDIQKSVHFYNNLFKGEKWKH